MMTVPPAPEAIGILLYPGAQLAAIHGLTDLLALATRAAESGASGCGARLEVSHWAFGDPGTPALACVHTSHPGSELRPGVVVVPPTMVELPDPQVRARIADWLRGEHARGTLLVSICSGVIFLAEAGLLGGRRASTHRVVAQFVAETFPEVTVDPGDRIIAYPDIITAGGFMAWVDVGLVLVQRYLGEHARAETELFLRPEPAAPPGTVPPRFMPPAAHGDLAVRNAQHHVHLHDGQGVSPASMAAAARLERRTFLRRFVSATGMTPGVYCRAVRMARARELLEGGTMAQKEIAQRLGFVDVSSFARAFRKAQGIAPGSYRKRFGGGFVAATGPDRGVPAARFDPAADSGPGQ